MATYIDGLLATAHSPTAVPGGGVGVLLNYLALVKPRVVSLVIFTAVVACFAAAGGAPPLRTTLILVLAGALAAGGAAALNHYLDQDLDARMERTRRRPLAAGWIRHPGLIVLGGAAMVGAGASLAATINSTLSLFVSLGAFVYVVLYTMWLKRRTPLNIVIGGLAGSSAVLGGWSAADPHLGIVPWLMAAIVFWWTPAHFWSLALARAADYQQAQVPMLPAVTKEQEAAWWIVGHIFATLILSFWLGLAAPMGLVYFSTASAGGMGFLALGVRLLRRPGPETGWQVFKFSGLYLGALFLGILLDSLLARF